MFKYIGLSNIGISLADSLRVLITNVSPSVTIIYVAFGDISNFSSAESNVSIFSSFKRLSISMVLMTFS